MVWRSVKLIKSWQQDKTFGRKTLKPLWHFLLCLLWWFVFIFLLWIQSVVLRGPLHYSFLSIFIHNDTRGKFSYKNWQLFIAQSSEDDLTFETDGRWATCLERFMQMEKLFSNQTEKSWQRPRLRFIYKSQKIIASLISGQGRAVVIKVFSVSYKWIVVYQNARLLAW